jgi:hypothetical protein
LLISPVEKEGSQGAFLFLIASTVDGGMAVSARLNFPKAA